MMYHTVTNYVTMIWNCAGMVVDATYNDHVCVAFLDLTKLFISHYPVRA